jgi:hypothetical protein
MNRATIASPRSRPTGAEADAKTAGAASATPSTQTRRRALLPWAGLALAYALLTALFTWPLAARLGEGVISPIDPVDSVWRVVRGQEQLLRAPWALFQGNTSYPYPLSFLFSELLVGASLIALPLRLATGNPVAIYNLAVLLTFVLSGLAMSALARRLGCGWAGTVAAGLIYAFAPLHMSRLGHLGMLSGQYFPLAILLLDRLFARPRPRESLALAVVLALQALSAQYYAFYLLFVVGGFVGLRLAQLAWRRRFPARAVWGHLLVAGGLAALAVLPFGLGFRAVQGDYAFERTIAQNAHYSANLASFFTADGQNWLWGRLTAPLRAHGTYTFERNMFPGLLALALALLGGATAWRKPLAQYLILLGACSAILALGPGLYLTADPKSLVFDYLPYRFLYYRLPGFDSMRVPARIGILYGLSVAGLAGLGLTWLLARVAARPSPLAPPGMGGAGGRLILPAALALAVLGGIGLESLNHPRALSPLESGERVPPVYRWLATQPATAAIELPFVIPDHERELILSYRYQYFSLYHGHNLVNGSGDVVPKGYKALFYELRDGPTPRALAILQGLDVSHLVVHYDQLDPQLVEPTRRTLSSLPAQVREERSFGETTVYRLVETDRFARLRAAIPPEATIYLSREDPTGAYGGMLTRVLRDNPIYTRVRVAFGQRYAGLPQPGARYDYAILYHKEDPAAAGFVGAAVVWEDEVVRVYRRAGP